jgi:TRAP-type mannitol/chloroaromatic compound transport system permease large subunit
MAPEAKLSTVFRGVLWFLPSYIIVMLLIQVFPGLVTVFSGIVK